MKTKEELQHHLIEYAKHTDVNDFIKYLRSPKLLKWFNNELIPKEFYYCEVIESGNWIFQSRDDEKEVTADTCCLLLDDNYCQYENSFLCYYSEIKLIRLATEEEKQLLISAVESNYDKNYNELTKNFE